MFNPTSSHSRNYACEKIFNKYKETRTVFENHFDSKVSPYR